MSHVVSVAIVVALVLMLEACQQYRQCRNGIADPGHARCAAFVFSTKQPLE